MMSASRDGDEVCVGWASSPPSAASVLGGLAVEASAVRVCHLDDPQVLAHAPISSLVFRQTHTRTPLVASPQALQEEGAADEGLLTRVGWQGKDKECGRCEEGTRANKARVVRAWDEGQTHGAGALSVHATRGILHVAGGWFAARLGSR